MENKEWEALATALGKFADVMLEAWEAVVDCMEAFAEAAAGVVSTLGAFTSKVFERCRWCGEFLFLTRWHVCGCCGGPPRSWSPALVRLL